jgi:peptide/nickel transport system substrate-binding protein
MMKRLIPPLLLLITLVWLPAGNAQDSNRILRAAIDQEPTSLNPYLTVQQAAYNFIDLYLLRPWLVNDEITYSPILVDALPTEVDGAIGVNDEGQSVVSFTLSERAVWSDGTPMSAADFIFPFEVANDGLSNFSNTTFNSIANVEEGMSAQEVVVTFAAFNPDWQDAGFYPLPEHVLREPYDAAVANGTGLDTLDWNLAPTVANGPFEFAELESGSFMRFVRSETFATQPWFEEVVVNFYADPAVMRAVLENNEADIAHNFQPADVIELQDNPEIVIDSKFDSGREAWWFNLGRDPNPALLDVRVRRAIALGLDRETIVEELLGGLTEVPNSFWDNTQFYNEDITTYPYDPEAAMALLEEAGWVDADGDGIREAQGIDGIEDGTPLVISVGTTTAPLRVDTQLVAQDMLGEIGIQLELSNYDGSNWATPFDQGGGFRGGFDDALQFFGFTAFTSIQATPWFSCAQVPSEDNPNGINATHTCYEELDALWSSLATEPDPAERQRIANEIQTFMADEVIWIGLWNRPQLTVYNTSLLNVRPGAQSPYWQVVEWERAE